jgi:twitching motility protein PilT
MVMALEVMVNTSAVASLVRHGDTYRIPSTMQTGKKYGMQLMDEHIIELLNANKIDPKMAQTKIEDRGLLREFMAKQKQERGKQTKGSGMRSA